MNSIDERIVGMRFDNAQFEKGVKQSMRTLQELKEASNLDDVAASIGDVSKSIDKNLQFQNPTKSAGIFSKALKGMGKVASKTFNAATFPVQALGRSIQSLGKYTRAVFGIDLASQLVNTGERVVRAFTIDPLKSGWNEYELKMDSIKTIMTGTVKTYTDAMTKKDPQFLYDEEKHLEYVKNGLEELNAYADKTIYSFQDMTSNIGKFTNAGVDFETAVDAIKGISNAAAHAGQGTAQASSAMYNLSQSLGMGYLGMMDWRSIENANMATLTFKQTLIDIGVALGQLKKDEKSGKLYTINEKGMMDTSMEVTAENLRETLSKKWVNKDVLLNALRVYSGEFTDDELRSLQNLSEEEKAALKKIGEEAAKAATQVRTFSKMWDALKEAAQSGWAISWELIFGDMNEATNFWTRLNDRFSGFLDRMAESRNKVLHEWRGQETYWDLDKKMYTWVDNPDAEDGRKILIESLHEMLDTIGRLGSAIGEAWNSVFGTIDAKKLIDITKRFSAFTKKFSDWLGSSSDKSSRISKLTSGLNGIFSLLKGAGSFVKGAFTTIANALHLDKVIDVGFNVFEKLGEWLPGIGETIGNFWETVGQTEIGKKVSESLSTLWDTVSKFFTETDKKSGKTGFQSFLESIPAAWENFKKTDFYKKSSDAIQRVLNFFEPIAIPGKQGHTYTIDSPFVTWVKQTWANLQETTDAIKAWSGWETIGHVFDALISVFKPLTALDENGAEVKTDSPFIAWVKKMWEGFQEVSSQIQAWTGWKTVGDVLEKVIDVFRPIAPGKRGDLTKVESPFVSWLRGAWETIKSFFQEIGSNETISAGIDKIKELGDLMLKFLIPSANAESQDGTKAAGIIEQAATSINTQWAENKGTFEEVSTGLSEKTDSIVQSIDKFDEEPKSGSLLQWFTTFGENISSAWNSVSGSISSIAADINKVTTAVSEAINGVVEWVQTVDWNKTLSDVEGHLWSFSGIFTLFSGGRLLNNVGRINKSGSKLLDAFSGLTNIFGENSKKLTETTGESIAGIGKNLGEGIQGLIGSIDLTKKLDAVGNVALKFAESMAILVGAYYAITQIVETVSPQTLSQANDIMLSLTVLIAGIMSASYSTGVSSSKIGTQLLELSVGVILMLRAISKIAKMSSEGIDFTSAILVIAKLSGLITAFSALSTAEGKWSTVFGEHSSKDFILSLGKNKKSGLIGFVVAIEGLILAIKQIAELSSQGVDMSAAIGVLWQLTVMLGAFKAFSGMEIGSTENGLLSFGKNNKSGLIGFTVAIEGLVLAVSQLSSLPKDKLDKGIEAVTVLTGLIAGFEVFKGIGNFLGTMNDQTNSSGLIGFIGSLTAMILGVQALGNLDPVKSKNGIDMLEQLVLLIDSFELSQGTGNALSHFASTAGQAINLGGLVAFIGGLAGLIYAIADLTAKVDDINKAQQVTNIIAEIAGVISGSGLALAGIMAALAKLGPAAATQGVLTFSTIFGEAGILGALVAGLSWLFTEKIFGEENLSQIAKDVEAFGQVFVALAKVLGDVIGALAGGAVKGIVSGAEEGVYKGIGDGLKSLVSTTNALTTEDLDQLKIVFEALRIISNKLPHNPGIFEQWFGGQMTLGQFGSNMEQLGIGFAAFHGKVSNITDFSTITSAINAIANLVKVAETMSIINEYGQKNGTFDFGALVYQMFRMLDQVNTELAHYGEDNLYGDQFDPIISFVELFNADVIEAAGEITIEPIIKSIEDQFISGKTRISNSFGSMFPDSVVPVYNGDSNEESPFLSYQNGSISLSGTVQIDPSSLSSVVSAINNQGSRISSAISNLGNRIDSVAAAVRSMKIVLSTGAIAGAVDGALGFNNTVYGRTGASSDYHPNGGSVNANPNYVIGRG